MARLLATAVVKLFDRRPFITITSVAGYTSTGLVSHLRTPLEHVKAWRDFATSTREPGAPPSPPGGQRVQPRNTLVSIDDWDHAEHLYPQSRAQRVFTARVERTLVAVLNNDLQLRSSLVEPYGLVVHAVRISHDRHRAAILWDCRRQPPRLAEACRAALARHGGRVRSRLAMALGARVVPSLEWRHAALDGPTQVAVALMDEIEREMAGGEMQPGAKEVQAGVETGSSAGER
ncbi:hypothetical protein Agub_g7394 [Astrephomene gubernaculifera]|uniref:Ribosome-binding factor A n=1 Tax=Astrephomene gubernaculifera TaxID=47775 RepID=A0AAD3DS21_9CHLO|nr:hypothetical protein Agub_g7394 [Astrephomene gubernaculifera]